MLIQKENESRQSYMLRVAAAYILEHCSECIIDYDETSCDGYCLAYDCLSACDTEPDFE